MSKTDEIFKGKAKKNIIGEKRKEQKNYWTGVENFKVDEKMKGFTRFPLSAPHLLI